MRRRAITAVIVGLSTTGLAVVISSPGAAGAGTPGSLDPTFGSGGKVISNVGGFPTDELLQPNGDILVSLNQGAGSGGVARFLHSGALDSSFGSGGVAKTTTSTVAGQPTVEGGTNALALESSGKIVVASGARGANGASAFGVARFNANGTLDSTFGSGGETVATSPEEGGIGADTVLAEPNGKILVGGYRLVAAYHGSKTFGLIMRFNSNGTLDSTFGTAGQVTLPATSGTVDAFGLDAKGDIFALTSLTAAQTELSSTGAIDSTFAPATITSHSTGGFGAFDSPRSFLENDQSLEAHAVFTSRRGYKSQVQRFGGTGSLDPTFANPLFRYSGETSTLGKDSVDEAVVGPNGKIVAVGQHHPESTSAGVGGLGVERLDANGELDSTFGNGGGVVTTISESNNAYAAVVEPDGDIVVAGLAEKGENSNVVLLRYQG